MILVGWFIALGAASVLVAAIGSEGGRWRGK